MTQQPTRLTSAEIKRWFDQWDAVHRIGYDLYGFKKESTAERLPLLVQPTDLNSICHVTPDPDLPPHRQQVQKLAREQLCFSAQHFAFLLDSLYFNLWYQLDLNNQQIATNELTKLRVLSRIAAIGENVDTPENLLQFALRRAINQIGDDTLLLHQIWDLYGEHQPGVIRNALHTGNQWAMSAWQTLCDFLPDTAPPLTYIRTMAGARLIPYGSIPLIAFPSSAVATELQRDFLAIPHEMGHYLFWRGKQTDGWLFFKAVAALPAWESAPAWMQPWAEEVFADIVGTLIGGPVTVLSLQDMMLEKVGNLFLRNDGHYPLAAIRPFVGLKVCELMGWTQAWDGLNKRWEAFLVARLGSDWRSQCVTVTEHESADKDLRLDMVLGHLFDFAEAILGIFRLDEFKSKAWTSDDDYRAEDADFYARFSEKSPAPPGEDRPTPKLKSWAEIVSESLYQEDPVAVQRFAEAVESADWWSEILTMAQNETEPEASEGAQPISLLDWFAILYLGGWGDAGPTGGSPFVT